MLRRRKYRDTRKPTPYFCDCRAPAKFTVKIHRPSCRRAAVMAIYKSNILLTCGLKSLFLNRERAEFLHLNSMNARCLLSWCYLLFDRRQSQLSDVFLSVFSSFVRVVIILLIWGIFCWARLCFWRRWKLLWNGIYLLSFCLTFDKKNDCNDQSYTSDHREHNSRN